MGAERGRKILLFPALFLIYFALSVWKATFFCINWKIISLKRANLHLTFITFYSNKSFNLRVLETKHRIRDGNEKSVGCWIFVKKEQERRIRIPPFQKLLSESSIKIFPLSTVRLNWLGVLALTWQESLHAPVTLRAMMAGASTPGRFHYAILV